MRARWLRAPASNGGEAQQTKGQPASRKAIRSGAAVAPVAAAVTRRAAARVLAGSALGPKRVDARVFASRASLVALPAQPPSQLPYEKKKAGGRT